MIQTNVSQNNFYVVFLLLHKLTQSATVVTHFRLHNFTDLVHRSCNKRKKIYHVSRNGIVIRGLGRLGARVACNYVLYAILFGGLSAA